MARRFGDSEYPGDERIAVSQIAIQSADGPRACNADQLGTADFGDATASAYQTAADLVKAAKASPGRINYASPGVGTPHHMAMELFKSTAGVSITHIPYRGTGPALTDLLGGQVECMFLPIHVALTHVKAGKLRALGIGSRRRQRCCPMCPRSRRPRRAM
jgi:hypothetical protein